MKLAKPLLFTLLVFMLLAPYCQAATITETNIDARTILTTTHPTVISENSFYSVDNGIKTRYYKDSSGYDQVLRPDGTVFVHSQRYTVEYLSGKTWKQIGTPYEVVSEQIGDEVRVTRRYTDYLDTEIEVIYHVYRDAPTKMDVVINSGETRDYRIVWSLNGVTNNVVSYGNNYVKFISPTDWVTFDWNDAFDQYGDITDVEVTDSANGKKLDVIFNVGTIQKGETFILDPTIENSYTGPYTASVSLKDHHPSNSAERSALGQAFNASDTYNISSVQFYLREFGTCTGNSYAVLYATSGTFGTNMIPSGGALATSDAVATATMPGAFAWVWFNFSTSYELQEGTTYAIVYQNPTVGDINAVDYIGVGVNATGPLHPGNTIDYKNSAWGGLAYDTLFRVYAFADPTNDAVVSTAVFPVDESEWVNVTVSDTDGVTDLKTVDIQVNTTGDVNNFTLRWTQATNTFSEVSDPDGICTLDTVNSTRINVDWDTDQICFKFAITGGQAGNCDVTVTTTDDRDLNDVDIYLSEFNFNVFDWADEIYDLVNSGFGLFGIIDWIGQATTFITAIAAHFADSLIGLATMINLQFMVIWAVFTWFTTWTTRMITNALAFGTAMRNIMNGVTFGVGDIWSDFNFSDWGPDLLPVFLTVHWINTVNRRAKTQGLFTVLNGDLNAFANVFAFFMGAFSAIIGYIESKVGVLTNYLNI